MLISDVIMKNKRLLRSAIDESLAESHLRTWSNCRRVSHTPEEPDYIADLSLNWISDVARILGVVLRTRFRVGITGVFCHQKPLADFGSTPRPEIGDLLLVLKYQESGNTPIFNSLLLQAKMSIKESFTLGTGELHQLKLYEQWPGFCYARAGSLNGQARDIHPKCPSTGAKYLLVDPRFIHWHRRPFHFPFGCAVPNRSITLTKGLADEFIDFLTLDAGKLISDKVSISEHWSQMIWDLLEITKDKCAKRKRSGLGKGFPRQTASTMDGYFYTAGEGTPDYLGGIDAGGEGANNESDWIPDDESGGISVIFLQISATDIQG